MKFVSFVLFASSSLTASLLSGGASSNSVWGNFETRLHPDSPTLVHSGGGTLTNGNVIQRHIVNMDNATYFGYDLVVERLPGNRYELRFGPLTIFPEKTRQIFKLVPAWTQLPLPASPVAMQVSAGETVELDLFVNNATGQKITDYLSIKSDGRSHSEVAGAARDFSPANAELAIISPESKLDGKSLLSSRVGVSGEAVWMDVPGHGRFVFSLAPHAELSMTLSGEVRGDTMTWQSGGHEYSLLSKRSIAGGSSAYNLYLFYTPRAVSSFGLSAGQSPEAGIRGK